MEVILILLCNARIPVLRSEGRFENSSDLGLSWMSCWIEVRSSYSSSDGSVSKTVEEEGSSTNN